MTERPHPVRVFLDVRDPWARRVLREALGRERDVRFVATLSAADVVIGEGGTRVRSLARLDEADAPGPALRAAATTSGMLTDREREVLQALAEGLSNASIAERLGISTSTVKFHLGALFEKLGVHRRAEAVAVGVRRGDVLL